jgi:hypothetical protein
MVRSIHGHYGTELEREARRIIKYFKDELNIDISWREATDLAALRSGSAFWNNKTLKGQLSKLRGI